MRVTERLEQDVALVAVDDELANLCRPGADLQQAILQGSVKRLRPKFMTVATTFAGLVPIMWTIGAGSDVMKRIAAPMIGGILTSFVLELVIYPPLYQMWKWNSEVKRHAVFPDA